MLGIVVVMCSTERIREIALLRSKHSLVANLVILISLAVPVNAQSLNDPADLDLDTVFSAINFGVTTDQVIGGVSFRAATANSTVDGVNNSAVGTVGVHQNGQTLPEIGSSNDDNALEQILGNKQICLQNQRVYPWTNPLK